MAAILAFLFHWVEILFFKFTDFNFTIFFFFSYDLPLFGKFFFIFSLLNLFLYPLTKKGFKGYAYIYFTFFVLSLHYCKFQFFFVLVFHSVWKFACCYVLCKAVEFLRRGQVGIAWRIFVVLNLTQLDSNSFSFWYRS